MTAAEASDPARLRDELVAAYSMADGLGEALEAVVDRTVELMDWAISVPALLRNWRTWQEERLKL